MTGTIDWRLRAPAIALSTATFIAVMFGGAITAQAAGPDPVGTIYVADYSASAIDVFAPGADGNVAPIRRIVGPSTGVNGPADVAVDSAGDVYSSNFNNSTITEYAPGASGNAAPIRTIGGANTLLANNDDISLTPDGTLFSGNNSGASTPVEVFAPGANGNATPERTLSGSNTGLSVVDGLGADATGTLYVDNSPGAAIEAFAPGATGNVAPIRTIVGSNTGLQLPDDVKVGFLGQLVVSDQGTSAISVFAPGANGNVAPTQRIVGSNTGINTLDDLAVDPSGNMYVTNFSSNGVEEFASNANGNVAPIAHITGPNTTLQEPEGIVIATASSNLTLTTSSSGSIVIGDPTQDTATLSGGNSPTGALVFNLYGPGDPSCTGAPAFTSAPVTVNGNGNYNSPAFTPTALGSYSWVAEYSGDGNNPPETTACNDQAEQVTVGRTDPAINAAGAGTLNATEGKFFSAAVATFTDPDRSAKAGEYSASISWGDGTANTGTISGSPTKFTVSGTHTYFEEGSFAVKVTITDTDHKANAATVSSTAKVGDAALSATGTRPSTSGGTAKGKVASFTDADPNGLASDYTAQINWGDGHTSSGSVTAGGGKFAVSGNHNYAQSGTYTIKTTIKDVGGSTATATTSVTMQVKAANVGRRPPSSARLSSVPRACVSRAFSVRVQGTRIASVSFTLDGRQVRGTTIHRGKQYSARISASPGRHSLTVRVKFRSGSAARSRTFRRIVRGCAPPPVFTG